MLLFVTAQPSPAQPRRDKENSSNFFFLRELIKLLLPNKCENNSPVDLAAQGPESASVGAREMSYASCYLLEPLTSSARTSCVLYLQLQLPYGNAKELTFFQLNARH